jgi:tRNA1(Val) A37 N6-methylase TrmN6
LTLASDTAELTQDEFLDGLLKIWQPRHGYRAGIDPVLLAAAVPAKAGQHVLEIGCGAGVAALCLVRRIPGVQVTGVELQAGYADLARRNAQENQIDLAVQTADIADLPLELRQQSFDHVMANPPYFNRNRGSVAADAGRETGRGETTDLAVWVDGARKRLRPGGWATFIQRAERLPELSGLMASGFGDIRILPIAPRISRAARLVIVQGRKNARGHARLLSPFVLHSGAEHLDDADDYSPQARSILRHAGELCLSD